MIDDNQHDFTMSIYHLTTLVSCFSGVTVLVDKGRAIDVIYLDLSKAFDTVPYGILISKSEGHGFDGWTTQ